MLIHGESTFKHRTVDPTLRLLATLSLYIRKLTYW
jgi:hypothetical protein